MVQILKRRSGFTIVEILVATLILSIGALAFFAMIKTVTTFTAKARANDAAYSIARQRLSLMQDGELLVRPAHHDSTTRDGAVYYTLDEVDTAAVGEPLRLTVTVSWGDPVKTVSISGYLNRAICPDTGIVLPPDSITISNATIPEDAPSNTMIGELTIYDRDSSDLHMYLYNDTIKDNELFKVTKGKLYTTKPLTVGTKVVELGVSDCAGNESTFDLEIEVTPYDSVPSIEPQSFSLPENSITGKVVGKVQATPLNVQFRIISQSPVSPFSVGTDGTLMVGSSSGLNYEVNRTITVNMEVTNLQWHDTAAVTVSLTNVNESPTAMTFVGVQSKPLGTPAGTTLGTYTITDPDSGDNNHTVSIQSTSPAFPFFTTDVMNTKQVETRTSDMDAGDVGSYLAVFTATDAGGLTRNDTIVLAITDTAHGSTSSCGTYSQYMTGVTYNANNTAYSSTDMYIYKAKWWTQSAPTLTNNDWKFIGACDGSAACADFQAYANGREYNAGALVTHNGKIYTTNTYVKNKIPPTSPWTEVSPCN